MLELSKCVRQPNVKTEEEFYLVDITGSQSSIYNFSNAKIFTLKDLNNLVNEWNYTNEKIIYDGFDNRIGFHKWHLIGDREKYKNSHILWILSTSKEHPWLSQCTYGDFAM